MSKMRGSSGVTNIIYEWCLGVWERTGTQGVSGVQVCGRGHVLRCEWCSGVWERSGTQV